MHVSAQHDGAPLADAISPQFSPNFLKGVALSVFQNSGDGPAGKSNWSDFIVAKNYLGQRKHAAAFHTSNDFWHMCVGAGSGT